MHLSYALVSAASARATLSRLGARQLLNNNGENSVNIRGGEVYLPRDPTVICFPV